MSGPAQCIRTEVCVPENQIAKIKRIAGRMRFEAGMMSYEEHKTAEAFRCSKCGKISHLGTQTDIGYICEDCNNVSP